MAYADQKPSGNRIAALIVVAVLHILLGYGLVTGLAFSAVKQIAKRVTTIDIEEEKKEETPPPPPPERKDVPPPPVAPPPTINVNPEPAVIQTAPPQPAVQLAPPAPPPPPPPSCKPRPPQPKGNPGDWANSNDYPSRALREEREGVTRFSVMVGADGKVQSCQVTGSSGHADLDSTTCSLITRRARFKIDNSCPEAGGGGSWSNAVRWQIPK